MKLKQAAVALALATGLAGAFSAFANGGPDERPLWEMLQQSAAMRGDHMVTKSDKQGNGMLSAEEIAKLLDPNIANP